MSTAGWWDLLQERDTAQQFIVGGRLFYSMQFGTLPVFSIPQLAFTDSDRQGLGGFDTLRGYKRERFIGASAMALSG